MRNLLIGYAMVSPVLLILLWPYAPLVGVGLMIVSHALLLYPTLAPNVQWLGPVVTRFDTDNNDIWLTIDDGPTADTAVLLDALDRRGVKATFFVKGALARRHPERVREMVARGHSVANHSETHPAAWFWCLLPARVAAEIDRCGEALAAIGGAEPSWFRAPVGMQNPAVYPHLKRRGMRLIGWTIRGFDATRDNVEAVTARIVPATGPGSIIVMHQGRDWSVRTIERVVDELLRRGFRFVIPEDGRLRFR
jgi:peptidoglycan/xylan/chitin deacetylase (PgdA/CDA1 family)